jgi:hypothetical protein
MTRTRDESRAAAIKKKQKLDPFDIPHGKKKKKHLAKNDVSGQGKLSVLQSSSQNVQDDARKPDSLIEGTQSPSKKQKTSEQEPLTRNGDLSPLQDPELEEVSSMLTKNEHLVCRCYQPKSIVGVTGRSAGLY